MPTMPDTPVPASIEFQRVSMVGKSENPFTGQQQFQSWRSEYWEASVSLPPMAASDWSAWESFFMDLDGTANTFGFPSAVCSMYPAVFTTDGSTPRAFRVKENSQMWSVEVGNIFHCVFEVREVLS